MAKKYVLVYAPDGIVGQDGSTARLFGTYEEAYKTMYDEVLEEVSFQLGLDEDEDEFEDEDELFSIDDYINEWHATGDCGDPDAAEWHIYEV